MIYLPSSNIILALTVVTSVTAIDYKGGWNDDQKSCVNICVNSKPTPGCFDPADADCAAKKQRPGDYDYLLYDQIFAPQYCRDLTYGNDTTITLQNVNPYPDGITCVVPVSASLFPHGLWPNYFNGYPGCCNVSDTVFNQPFNAETFETKYPDLFSRMEKEWIQPAFSLNASESLCHIYNHEYQKHGVCYRVFDEDWDKGAEDYFTSTLEVNDRVSKASKQIATWSSKKAKAVMLSDIESLYEKKVAILCSKYELEIKNRFQAVRTCWAKPENDQTYGVLPGDQIDCTPTAPDDPSACSASEPISFDAYVPLGKEPSAKAGKAKAGKMFKV